MPSRFILTAYNHNSVLCLMRANLMFPKCVFKYSFNLYEKD